MRKETYMTFNYISPCNRWVHNVPTCGILSGQGDTYNSSSVQNSCWHVPMKTDTAPVLEHLPAEVGLGVGYQRGQGGARVFANE